MEYGLSMLDANYSRDNGNYVTHEQTDQQTNRPETSLNDPLFVKKKKERKKAFASPIGIEE